MSQQLKLYMPITVFSYRKIHRQQEDSMILEEYIPEIRENLKNIMNEWDLKYGKNNWYAIPYPLEDFMSSYFLDVEKVDDTVYLVGNVAIKKSLNSKELEMVKGLVRGEVADGIGELLEYEVISTAFGKLELVFWDDEGWFLKTKEELDTHSSKNQH